MELKTITLADITPINLLRDSNISAAGVALNPNLQEATSAIDEVLIYGAIDTLPMPIIEALAWQFHVSSGDEGWYLAKSDNEKRAIIKNTIALHKIKGTKAAIVRIFELLSLDATVEEWWEYAGSPYHFKIDINSPVEITTDIFNAMGRMVDEYKPVRSVLDNINLNYMILTTGSWATSYHSTEEVTVYPY